MRVVDQSRKKSLIEYSSNRASQIYYMNRHDDLLRCDRCEKLLSSIGIYTRLNFGTVFLKSHSSLTLREQKDKIQGVTVL